MSEMQTMDQAATTTEGTGASQGDASQQANASQQASQTQQATDGQTNQANANTDGKAGQDQGKPADTRYGAPEAYDFKPPEGQQFDSDVISMFGDVAKEMNLSQEAAQKMLDKMAPVVQQRQMQQLEEIRTNWANEASADKEYGGDKLQENLAVAKKALDNFGTPELRSLLNESGLGNHPEVIRFMFRAGKAISADRFVGGARQGGNNKPTSNADFASSLYPSQQ
jgi:hypothetical protein